MVKHHILSKIQTLNYYTIYSLGMRDYLLKILMIWVLVMGPPLEVL